MGPEGKTVISLICLDQTLISDPESVEDDSQTILFNTNLNIKAGY